MNIEFRDWAVGKIKETTGDDKQAFLRMLKTQPEMTANFIRAKFEDWMILFSTETGRVIIIPDFKSASEELRDYCKQYFSKELEAIK